MFWTDEARFLARSVAAGLSGWDNRELWEFGSLVAPDAVLGDHGTLLRADINARWASWFVECLVDPERYAGGRSTKVGAYADVLAVVERHFGSYSARELEEVARVATDAVWEIVKRREASAERSRLSWEDRSLLLDIAGSPARCWICGEAFPKAAIENFRGGTVRNVSLPDFVDIFKPRGLSQRDLAVEVDHVVPHSQGGGDSDNLRLACGWCNRHKSARTSIYDVRGPSSGTRRRVFRGVSVPEPFWTIRMLGVIRRCEHRDGCDRSVDDSPLTVYPAFEKGAMNPVNLLVTCREHDPYGGQRRQPRSVAARVWRRR